MNETIMTSKAQNQIPKGSSFAAPRFPRLIIPEFLAVVSEERTRELHSVFVLANE